MATGDLLVERPPRTPAMAEQLAAEHCSCHPGRTDLDLLVGLI
jgi:hypothetical protein